jgi:Flp pilus assembly protein TadD
MLGMLSKEMAVTLPLVMFGYDYIYALRLQEVRLRKGYCAELLRGIGRTVWNHRWLYLPLFVCGAVFAWYFVFIGRPSEGFGWYGGNVVNNFLTVARIWVYYLYLLIYPVKLLADYSGAFPIAQSAREWSALAALGLLGGLFVLILVALRRHRLAAFSGLWIAITLLPVSHIVPHHELLAEHYLYLPSFGFCLLVALGLARLTEGSRFKVQSSKSKERQASSSPTQSSVLSPQSSVLSPQSSGVWRGVVGYGLLVSLLAFYAARTVTRNRDWRDDFIFYTRLVTDNPTSARARLGLGYVYDTRGMPRMAVTHYHVGLKFSPQDPRLYTNLGTSYQKLGMLREAEQVYQESLKLRPNDSRVLSNMGFLYTELRRYDEARTALEKAERLSRGRDAAVYANWGLFYEVQRNFPEALAAYRKAVALAPENAVFAQKVAAIEKELEAHPPAESASGEGKSAGAP